MKPCMRVKKWNPLDSLNSVPDSYRKDSGRLALKLREYETREGYVSMPSRLLELLEMTAYKLGYKE